MGDAGASEAEAALRVCAIEFADAVFVALPIWVTRSIVGRCEDAGVIVDDTVLGMGSIGASRAAADLGGEVAQLLATDIEDQRTTPLELLRTGVIYPTRVLSALGVPPVARDEFTERAFRDDVYDLSPASFAEVDESLREPGLRWGAAKAFVHLARRRGEGQR